MQGLTRSPLLIAVLSASAWFVAFPAQAVSPPPAQGQNGMVASAHKLASQIGVDVLKQGGNAVDAAVAVGYALAVTLPQAGNLGGGGFLVIRMADGRETMVDFREAAPLAASADMYLDQDGKVRREMVSRSWLGAAVPGTVAGLEYARQHYGTLPSKPLVMPAVALARDGYALTQWDDVVVHGDLLTTFAKTDAYVGKYFLNGGKPYRAGETFRQPALAKTLQTIADNGPQAFYQGWIADETVRASKAGGGIFTPEDFTQYQALTYKPIHCSYRGYELVSAAPPSSGGISLCESLNVLENVSLKDMGQRSAASTHLYIETLRRAFADRNVELGDPRFVDNPVDNLISKSYAQQVRASIDLGRATPSSAIKGGTPVKEGNHTTHYSIVDKAGNAVSVTYSLGLRFGTGKVAGDAGFFLNDTMEGFTAKVGAPNVFGLIQGKANAIAPAKRSLSSMTPTVVLKDGKVYMVTGSPGGPRIITTTLQTILNVIDYGMDVQAAVDAPRIHHQWLPDTVYLEAGALSPDTRVMLEKMGHHFTVEENWSVADAIVVDRSRGLIFGGHDNRAPAGAALGY